MPIILGMYLSRVKIEASVNAANNLELDPITLFHFGACKLQSGKEKRVFPFFFSKKKKEKKKNKKI